MPKKSSKKSEDKFDKYFLLNWKKLFWIIIISFISVILHNLIYAVFDIEEAVFFVLAVIIIPLYFIIVVIYTLIKIIQKKKKISKAVWISVFLGGFVGVLITITDYFPKGPFFIFISVVLVGIVAYAIIRFFLKE
ncbi:MAG: hypothetical protein OQK82_06845 [Candidatus Pacearchaeota archaeon]|nr:hypothetical protein [Candidatus Pacearchaeota archaeon]